MVDKQKVLIVDDDQNIADLISLYFTKECFNTQIVNDGESALSVFDTFKPDIILLDLMLPGIDGYQVCREIRSKSAVPIIMLSAKGEVFDKVIFNMTDEEIEFINRVFNIKSVVENERRNQAPTVQDQGE